MAVLRRTNKEHEMPGNAREMATTAERSFPVRVRIAVPRGGRGRRLTELTTWLDDNCGSDCWAMTASGVRGVLNDAISRRLSDGKPSCLIAIGATAHATLTINAALGLVLGWTAELVRAAIVRSLTPERPQP